MSKMLRVIAAIVCIAEFSGAAFASHKVGKHFGEIVSIDAAAGQIVVTSGKGKESENITIAVNAETKIIKAGKTITFADLVAGNKVKFKLSSDNKTASSIVVLKDKIEASATPAAPPEP